MNFEMSLDEFIAQYRESIDLYETSSFGGGDGGNESNSGNEGNEGDENNEGDEGNEGNFFSDVGSGISNGHCCKVLSIDNGAPAFCGGLVMLVASRGGCPEASDFGQGLV